MHFSQFFKTNIGIQTGPDVPEQSFAFVTLSVILRVLFLSTSTVILEGKTNSALPISARFVFKEECSVKTADLSCVKNKGCGTSRYRRNVDLS